MRKRYNRKPIGTAPLWMVTFSDLMTLLLCFFVFLFTFSNVDMVKFKAMSDSFRRSSILEGGISILSNNPPLHANTNVNGDYQGGIDYKPRQLDSLYEAIMQYLEDNKLEAVISAARDEFGVSLEIRDRVLFDSGSAEIKDEGIPFLEKVGQLIQSLPNPIEIEGHTDNQPIITSQYPSNWELSTARSAQVARYFISEFQVNPQQVSVSGYGEYRPVLNNDTAENRAINRRVVIHIGEMNE